MGFKDFSNKIDIWDQKIILKYNGIGGKPTTLILKVFSFFGRETIWICLIAFYLLIWYDPFLFSYISATFLIGLVLILAIKQTVRRKRPFDRFEASKIMIFERKPTSKSFPSWHSYNVVAYGLLFGLSMMNSLILTFVFLGFAIVVSFSRIQLGVHYPTDVIFGSIFGIVGFLFTHYIIGPLLYRFITYLEHIWIYEIYYREINPILANNEGYLFLCFIVFFIIFLLAIIKPIREYIRKK